MKLFVAFQDNKLVLEESTLKELKDKIKNLAKPGEPEFEIFTKTLAIKAEINFVESTTFAESLEVEKKEYNSI